MLDLDRSNDVLVDVIVPVHDALALARRCINAVLSDRPGFPVRIWLVDDASDGMTARYLESVAALHAHVAYLRNDRNLGFLQSCNRAIRKGSAAFVVLLNSDTVVPPGWLDRLVRCANDDGSIGSVNPLTNRASQIDFPMPAGVSFLALDRWLASRPLSYHDIVTGVGFCMLLRREALDEVGLFDEAYGFGYCEESDLCMRLTTRGWRTVVLENCYVFHRGGGSFRDRGERYRRNRELFDSRWRDEYHRQFRAFQAQDPLRAIRNQAHPDWTWDPRPDLWALGRLVRKGLGRKGSLRLLVDAARRLPRALVSQRPTAAARTVERFSSPGMLTVTYLLPQMVVAGGVLSVIQLVNELNLLGIDARIATRFVDPAVREWMPLMFEPMVFRSWEKMIRRIPHTDIVVATHWTSAEFALAMCQGGRARQAAYFVQDYEPWFVGEDDVVLRRRIEASYRLIDHLIVKSAWLRDMLRGHGAEARIIPLGMETATFYPRDVPRRPLRVVAMARPGTPRRGFETLRSAFSKVKMECPESELIVFGQEDVEPRAFDVDVECLGLIDNQDELAALYSTASVFVDSSHFQGFGRCALEAMACGAAAVVTKVGGVSEYAKHEETALVVDPQDPEALAASVIALLLNEEQRSCLAESGRAKTEEFCHLREATATASCFREIVGCTP